MDVKLVEYQKKCVDLISERIAGGAKRISLVMSAGMGKSITSIYVAKELTRDNDSKVLMVHRYRLLCEQSEMNIAELQLDNIDCCMLRAFSEIDLSKYRYIFLYEMNNGSERDQISAKLSDYEGITISVFTPFQELAGDENVDSIQVSQKLFSKDTQIVSMDPGIISEDSRIIRIPGSVYVFETKTIVDIRDIKKAKDAEEEFVQHEIIIQISVIKTERNHVEERVSELNSHLEKYVEEIAELKKQIGKNDELLAERESVIKEHEAKIKEDEAVIEEKNQMIDFLMTLLGRHGYSREILISTFERLQNIREGLKGQLESDDEEIAEAALKKLQDETVATIDELIMDGKQDGQSRLIYDQILENEITIPIWEKLSEKSKNFLVTAKITFDSMKKLLDSDSLDYSGVCLLVTKAIEVEATDRFFLKYKEYLSQKYFSVSQWPYGLRKWINGSVKDEVIDDAEFTLGKVVAAIGIKRIKDNDGKTTGYQKINVPYNTFLDYAKKVLYIDMEINVLETKIKEDYLFIEKVRTDYRNPSAHKGELNIVSATECLDYVIEKQKELKRMLGNMKI